MLIDIILLVWLHFLADFLLQTDRVAIEKSGNFKTLAFHCWLYSIPLLYFGAAFAAINGVLHFITDFFTSRACSKLYKDGHRHWFFVVIGLDQAIHFTCLLLTYHFIL